MNESFTDYSKIGKVKLNADPLDDIHNMKDLRGGMMVSSVYGGYTANPEFEFLTGMSLCFLPESRVPFLSYFDNYVKSVISDLTDDDYYTFGLHPYYGAEFNRITVYNNCLGFDKAVFGENMGELLDKPTADISDLVDDRGDFGNGHEYIRGFISDKECYERILTEVDKKEKNFIFNVTVQNHGGYGNINYSDNRIKYTDDDSWNDYFYGLSKSDDGFAYFIDELKKRDGRYIVLMFGDHQPALPNMTSYVDIDPEFKVDGGEMPLYKYLVPYYMWTNTDSEIECPKYISANFMSLLIKKVTGLSYNNWDRLREKVYDQFNIMTPQYISKDGNSFELFDRKKIVGNAILNDYNIVQYDRLFG